MNFFDGQTMTVKIKVGSKDSMSVSMALDKLVFVCRKIQSALISADRHCTGGEKESCPSQMDTVYMYTSMLMLMLTFVETQS